MPSPSRKTGQSFESQLNAEEKSRLAQKIGESAKTSGAASLPPPGSVPIAVSYDKALESAPPEMNPASMTALPILALGDAIGGLPANTPLERAMIAQLGQQVQEAKAATNAAPIQTGAAKLSLNGRTTYIPESVRDVPNALITHHPEQALERYWLFTSDLSDDEAQALLDLANRRTSKPLMWLSEQMYYLLAVLRWMPPKGSTVDEFTPDDANPASKSYKLIMDTFGPDCGNQMLVTAERCNISILGLVKFVALRLLEIAEEELDRNRKHQTVESWKRPSNLSSSSVSQGSLAVG